MQLNDLIVPAGDHRGSSDAIPVRAAFTVVDRPINDVLVGNYMVVIFDEVNPETIVACGPIGGVLDASGALSIGIVPSNESGTVGVAYLSSQNNGTATGISIFVIQQP